MLLPVDLDGLTVLVETVDLGGSEGTSGANRAAERAAEMLVRAQATIEKMALAVMDTGKKISAQASQATQVEVQFGIKFGAEGSVIISGLKAEASLVVKLILGPIPNVERDESYDYAADPVGE